MKTNISFLFRTFFSYSTQLVTFVYNIPLLVNKFLFSNLFFHTHTSTFNALTQSHTFSYTALGLLFDKKKSTI